MTGQRFGLPQLHSRRQQQPLQCNKWAVSLARLVRVPFQQKPAVVDLCCWPLKVRFKVAAKEAGTSGRRKEGVVAAHGSITHA